MAEKFTGNDFMDFCEKFLGRPYWYGTTGHPCTASLLKSKSKQYPTHYTASRMSKYNEAIRKHEVCSDCIGLSKAYAWTNGGENVIESIGLEKPLYKINYASNNLPDKSANGMFEYAKKLGKDWGPIGNIPEIRGLAVRYPGHVGYYDGNGYVIEERGFKYGCVKTKLKDRPWTHWYKMPHLKYENEKIESANVVLGSRTLKKGMKGTDVKELQEKLIKLGYDLGSYGADDDFGNKTDAAVRAFQKNNLLTIDGIVGKKTIAKLIG